MAITTKTIGDVLVVEFEDEKLLDEAVILEVGDELMKLVPQCAGKKMLLDFRTIELMSSSMIGKIVFLNTECKKSGVVLKICKIGPNVMEVFTLMSLDKVLDIYDDPEKAIKSF